MHAYGPDPEDPSAGLAPERTELAWNRTGLAVFVSSAVLLRRVSPLDSAPNLLAAAAIGVGIALWATATLVASHRGAAALRAPGRDLRRVLIGTLAFAAAAFALSLFPPT